MPAMVSAWCAVFSAPERQRASTTQVTPARAAMMRFLAGTCTGSGRNRAGALRGSGRCRGLRPRGQRYRTGSHGQGLRPVPQGLPVLLPGFRRLTVGMPYCAAKTRSRPGAIAFGAGVINAIVLIAMVAGVGASGLLSGWITRAGPSLRSHIWERGDRCSRDPVVGTHLCVHSPMRHEHTGNQHVGTDEGSVRPKPLWEEWLEKASLVIRAADGIVAAAV